MLFIASRSSRRFYKYFCRRKAAVVLREVAEGLRFDCGQYGSLAVFAVRLRFPAVEPSKWYNAQKLTYLPTVLEFCVLK